MHWLWQGAIRNGLLFPFTLSKLLRGLILTHLLGRIFDIFYFTEQFKILRNSV